MISPNCVRLIANVIRHQAVAYITVALVIATGQATANANTVDLDRGCIVTESQCHTRPLFNGRPGETVRVCERVRVTCNASSRQGTTTVTHIGR